MKEVNFMSWVENEFYARFCKIARNKNSLLKYNCKSNVKSTPRYKSNRKPLTDIIII